MRGLGFGVGREPLTAVFASRGCEIVATDLGREDKFAQQWAASNQNSQNVLDLNDRCICAEDAFLAQVSFEPADMNKIPAHFDGGFDFCWSACCLEHLGSISNGQEFYRNSLKTLRPGGLAIHTTEFNLSSNEDTLDNQPTVIFRERDLRELIARLETDGHYVEPLLLHLGSYPNDGFVDLPPYSSGHDTHPPHLRMMLEAYVTTSVGIITRKAA